MNGIYIWPRGISDDELLSKIYTTLFTRLSQMQLHLIKGSRVIFEQYDLIENMVLDSSTLPVSKDDLFRSAKMFHYENELDSVLTIVDSIGSKVRNAAFKNSRGRVNKEGRYRAAIRIGGRGNQAHTPILVRGKRDHILDKT
jgi:hypothetical protein